MGGGWVAPVLDEVWGYVEHQQLASAVKTGQRLSPSWKGAWGRYCETQGGTLDPAKHTQQSLVSFFEFAGAQASLAMDSGASVAAAALPAGGTAERTNARRWLRSLVSAGVVGGDGSGAADPDFLWTAFASQGLDSATALFALNDCCLCGGSTCSGGADRTGVALAATLRGCGAGGWLGMAPPMGLADFIGNGGDTATAWAVLGLGQVRRGAH